jgi:hypothetical protein
MRYKSRKWSRKPRIEPVYVTLKGDVPRAIESYQNAPDPGPDAPWSSQPAELKRVYSAWKGRRVELYGRVIKGYGDKSPWNADHVSCRLENASDYSLVNLDEFETDANLENLPFLPIGC